MSNGESGENIRQKSFLLAIIFSLFQCIYNWEDQAMIIFGI